LERLGSLNRNRGYKILGPMDLRSLPGVSEREQSTNQKRWRRHHSLRKFIAGTDVRYASEVELDLAPKVDLADSLVTEVIKPAVVGNTQPIPHRNLPFRDTDVTKTRPPSIRARRDDGYGPLWRDPDRRHLDARSSTLMISVARIAFNCISSWLYFRRSQSTLPLRRITSNCSHFIVRFSPTAV
jgi:hypothetical protein